MASQGMDSCRNFLLPPPTAAANCRHQLPPPTAATNCRRHLPPATCRPQTTHLAALRQNGLGPGEGARCVHVRVGRLPHLLHALWTGDQRGLA